ncbi:HEAT repeat domain-containing protein [Tautonia sociabilis]|uniref:HEAT repeat domain-containing protein n=1 Tax=Tautonia sociabilis TaxID=2080755 RepID=A0A432ME31_9BACT|nr:HEAT repeat domain-containing protein [Tautonia sociabilis]RUL83411.1 HEAT repeat domain-containing protein [Tautonia sociabilis]
MPPTPTLRPRDPGRIGAAGRVVAALAAALSAVGAIGLGPVEATAQAPGLETFAKQPETPLELWDAISYLGRVGRFDQAAPLLDRFLQADPDDATMLEIRDRFGVGSILRLQDDPRTSRSVAGLLDRLTAASRRTARREDRIREAIRLLTGSPLQQAEALLRLGESGPYAVPYLLEAVASLDPGSPDRALLVGNLGRLDRRAVPALIAGLDAPDPVLAAEVASALGRIGDRRALPFLVAEATGTVEGRDAVRNRAAEAVARLTGAPIDAMTPPPARFLLDEARRYLTGGYVFPSEQVELWSWREGTVAPEVVSPAEAEAILGSRFAGRALELAPDDREAAAVSAALRVRGQISGLDPADPDAREAIEEELAGLGPEALTETLDLALRSRQFDIAPALIGALSRSAEPTILLTDPPSPLVAALSAPDRRVQLAAALAVVRLNPTFGFPGSSRVVPTLSRCLLLGPTPEIVVVSGNSALRTTVASSVRALGYEARTAATADEAFALAAESAGVEALIIDPAFLQGGRDARDLLLDLRADARTAGLPALLVLPIDPARALARGEEYRFQQTETEPNDVPARASPVALVGRPRRARINGRLSPDDRPPYNQPRRTLPGAEPEDVEDPIGPVPPAVEDEDEEEEPPLPDISGDLFALGSLRSGDSISAVIESAPGSTLRPRDVALWLERREGPGFVPVATGVGSLAVTIDTPGVYDLRVQAADRYLYGYRALYILDIAVYDYDIAVPPLPGTARLKVEELASRFDRVAVVAAPGDASAVGTILLREWSRMGNAPIPATERSAMSRAAAEALGTLAGRPDGPFVADLARAVDPLRLLLSDSARAPSASSALAAVPEAEAQRSLADLSIDSSRPEPSRLAAARALRDSLARFGTLLADSQQARIVRARDRLSPGALREALDAVVDALAPAPLPLPPMAPSQSGAASDGARSLADE